MNVSWITSFWVYALALPIAVFFYFQVSEIRVEKQSQTAKEKMNPAVYALVLFAILLVMNSIAIFVRFSSIATELMGESFNASNYLALMPLLGIAAGFAFGFVNKLCGKFTLYLGIVCFITSNLLIAMSGSSFWLLVAGLFLSSIPDSWCFPYIFSNLDTLTTKNTVTLAISLIFIGCNIGNFIAPLAMSAMQFMTGSNALTAPFYIFAGILVAVLIVLVVVNRKAAGAAAD